RAEQERGDDGQGGFQGVRCRRFSTGREITSPPSGVRVESAARARRGTEAVTTAPIRNRLRALRPYEGSNPSLSANTASPASAGLRFLPTNLTANLNETVIEPTTAAPVQRLYTAGPAHHTATRESHRHFAPERRPDTGRGLARPGG